MSYDLQLVTPEGIDAERAEAALAAVGVELDDDEGLVEREGLFAQFLVAGGEIGVGIAGDGDADAFRGLVEVVIATAERLDARVLDPQAGVELDRTNLEAAVRAFG